MVTLGGNKELAAVHAEAVTEINSTHLSDEAMTPTDRANRTHCSLAQTTPSQNQHLNADAIYMLHAQGIIQVKPN